MTMKYDGIFTKNGTIFKTKFSNKQATLITSKPKFSFVTFKWKTFFFRDEKCLLLTIIDMTAIVLLREE